MVPLRHFKVSANETGSGTPQTYLSVPHTHTHTKKDSDIIGFKSSENGGVTTKAPPAGC